MLRRLLLIGALAWPAMAQEDPDIPPPFENLITPEQYHILRDAYINLIRGYPSDPALRDQAIQQMARLAARAAAGGSPTKDAKGRQMPLAAGRALAPAAPVTWTSL